MALNWKMMLVALLLFLAAVYMANEAKKHREEKKKADAKLEASRRGETYFDAQSAAKRLYDDFNGWTQDKSIYYELANTTDDNLREVWRLWNSTYKKDYGNRELAAAMNYAYSGFANWLADWVKANWTIVEPIYDRLKKMGLD